MSLLKIIASIDWDSVPEDPDKVLDDFSIRITPRTKHGLGGMPKWLKEEMNRDLRRVMLGYIHMSEFKGDVG
jgi:hypothetical protein